MEIETAASPAGEADTQATAPAPAAPEATAPAGGTTEANPDNQESQPADDFGGLLATTPDEAEIEYEGIKAKVPAVLKDAFLRHQDYTQKTMTLADERRQVEAAKAQIQEARQLSAAEIRAFAEINTLNDQLAQFQAVDWNQVDHSNPDVIHAKGVRDELIRKHQLINAQLNEHMAIKQSRAQQEAAREREQTDAQMAKVVKDWSAEKRSQFEAFAVSQGIPAEYAGQAGAAEMNIIRLAMIGAQAEQQRLKALKAATDAGSKPANEVGQGAGSGTSDAARMSMDQYIAARKAGKL
jgi:hypothetical protein